MSLYRRLKFFFDGCPNFTSQIASRKASAYSTTRSPGPSGFHRFSTPIFKNPGLEHETEGVPRFVSCGRRHYFVDRNQVQHFRPRGPRRWFRNPRIMITVLVVGSGIGFTLYHGNVETVPYSHRSHFVLLSRNLERELGARQFEQMKAQFRGQILPPVHPVSMRVRLIARDIIEALQRGVMQEQGWTEGRHELEGGRAAVAGEEDDISALLQEGGRRKVKGAWSQDDEILDDRWVQSSRRDGERRGSRPSTLHLDGLLWEVLVVNQPIVNAFCLPGGKIVVFTGLLRHFQTDAELATIIGHEVGHAVARHAAESITKNLWFTILQLVLYQFVTPDVVNTMSHLLLRLPFSRRMEMEADYIGLLLMASAGHDPRIAPRVYEKLGKLTGDSALRDYLSTHPSGKKRATLLANAKVMQEALLIYKDVRAGRGIQGFLSDSTTVIF